MSQPLLHPLMEQYLAWLAVEKGLVANTIEAYTGLSQNGPLKINCLPGKQTLQVLERFCYKPFLQTCTPHPVFRILPPRQLKNTKIGEAGLGVLDGLDDGPE